MKRRLLNLAAAVSLLLAVAVVFLWVRSHRRLEQLTRFGKTSTEDSQWAVTSDYSNLEFSIALSSRNGPPRAPWDKYQYLDSARPGSPIPSVPIMIRLPWFPFPPFRFEHYVIPGSPPADVKSITIAYWLLLPPTLILPTIAIVRHRRRRRRERGNLCPICGYDLRAHNTGDRCPECGVANPRAV